MRKGTHRKDTVAFPILTIHFYVVIAPFLDKLDHESGLHEPRKHGGEREYHLTFGMRRARLGHCGRTLQQIPRELRWKSCNCRTCRTSRLEIVRVGTLRLEKYRPAVEVKQKARPAIHEDPTVPSTPVNGRESKRPMDDQVVVLRALWRCKERRSPFKVLCKHTFSHALNDRVQTTATAARDLCSGCSLLQDLDEEAIKSHVLRLAQVPTLGTIAVPSALMATRM